MTNYYKILGLKDFASSEEIKIAYRKLSKKLHPDVNDGDKFFEERFVEIQEAYELLSDSRKRLSYDEDLKESLATDNNIDLQKLQNTLYKKYSGGHSQKKVVFFKPKLSKSATIVVIVSSLLFSIFLYLLAEEEKMLQKAQSVERIKDHRFSIGSRMSSKCRATQPSPMSLIALKSGIIEKVRSLLLMEELVSLATITVT